MMMITFEQKDKEKEKEMKESKHIYNSQNVLW